MWYEQKSKGKWDGVPIKKHGGCGGDFRKGDQGQRWPLREANYVNTNGRCSRKRILKCKGPGAATCLARFRDSRNLGDNKKGRFREQKVWQGDSTHPKLLWTAHGPGVGTRVIPFQPVLGEALGQSQCQHPAARSGFPRSPGAFQHRHTHEATPREAWRAPEPGYCVGRASKCQPDSWWQPSPTLPAHHLHFKVLTLLAHPLPLALTPRSWHQAPNPDLFLYLPLGAPSAGHSSSLLPSQIPGLLWRPRIWVRSPVKLTQLPDFCFPTLIIHSFFFGLITS